MMCAIDAAFRIFMCRRTVLAYGEVVVGTSKLPFADELSKHVEQIKVADKSSLLISLVISNKRGAEIKKVAFYKTGSVLIAAVHLLCAITGLVAVVNSLIVDENMDYALCFIGIIALGGSIAVSIAVIIGIRLEKKVLVTVYLSAQVN
uniref:CNNM transmembrane domain-containing protein n=1 Tax=Ascaris lumbricoides TaxID=6252 RepID=A0A0M3HRG4_ASCLU